LKKGIGVYARAGGYLFEVKCVWIFIGAETHVEPFNIDWCYPINSMGF
jgi:hypothetical protein